MECVYDHYQNPSVPLTISSSLLTTSIKFCLVKRPHYNMPKNVSSHSEEHIQPTLASVPVEIDPAVKGTLVRYALAIEAVLNVLNLMVTKPSDITLTSVVLT